MGLPQSPPLPVAHLPPHFNFCHCLQAPVGIQVRNSCCKSQHRPWSSGFTSVAAFYFWILLAFVNCRRGLSNSTCTASCPRPKTKEPFTLDCNMFATVFCSFFPSLPFTTAWLVQSQQLNEREKLSFLPQSGMGEEVSHSAPA